MMRPAHRMIRRTVCGLAVTLMPFCGAGKAAAASPQTASTDMCVLMTGSSGQVGGLQMDLRWDPACMTAERRQGNAAQCASNPATGKNVQTALFADNATMRAMFFSISDPSPIPDDAELFCCKFTLASSRSTPCCAVSITNLILSDPVGKRVYDANISVQALVGNAPCTASAPGGSPSNPVRPPAPSSLGGPAPVIVAPGVAAPGPGRESAGSRPAGGGGVPAGLEQAPPPAELAAPAEPTAQPTPAATAPHTRTPARTAAATTPTRAPTPAPQGTATAAAVGSATPQSSTQTPAAVRKPKKKHSP